MPFEKGNKLGGRKKGAVNKDTIAKEALYNNLWGSISDKMTGEGIEKCWSELMTLEGKDFVYAFNSLLEYFKPKLNRTTLEGGEEPVKLSIESEVQKIADKINDNSE